jgi:Fungal specific transcription factor domain
MQTSVQQQSEFPYPQTNQTAPPEVQYPLTPDTNQTDTFEPSNQWDSPIAIANKIRAIRRKVVPNENLDEMTIVTSNKTVSLTLPPPVQLRRQIDLFLSEFDDFSPFFRRSRVQKRIASALHSLSYGERQTVVHIPREHCTTFAILCSILSCAEIVSSTNSTIDPSTGQYWYLQGKRLMEEFENSIEDSLDVVVYHVLVAGNMMEAERLRTAALHIVRASHAALSIGLNDINRWKQRPDEIVSRSCLWWVLYFVEKRIHWKCGVPYFLRPSEVNVGESPIKNGDPEIEHAKLELVESMISYSQLWTSIWQEFMAPNHHTPTWPEMQVADAKVLIAYQQLPPRLLWDMDKVQEYLGSEITEIAMRQKLQVYLVSNLGQLLTTVKLCRFSRNSKRFVFIPLTKYFSGIILCG